MAEDDRRKPEEGADDNVRAQLFAHPLAFPAIATTIGVAMASQAFSFWMGALSGMMDVAHRPATTPAAKPGVSGAGQKPAETKAAPAAKPDRQPKAKAAAAPKAKASDNIVELRPAGRDDLKAISGVGPKLEQVLNKLGVTSYAQIAAWTADEISRIEDHFGFPGRVGRDGWIAQARALMDAKKRA